jgi:RsiW-degrading membrane proteinase PrsW (M82 family)
MPTWLKRAMAIAGLLMALPGAVPIAFACLCVGLTAGSDSDGVGLGVLTFTLMMLTLGAGLTLFWHSRRSLKEKPSSPVRLPPAWALTGVFAWFILAGFAALESNFAPALLFPPALAIAGALPPLAAVAWFSRGDSQGLTWRRGLVAFAGGATASVLIALLLEILFPSIVLVLVLDLADVVLGRVDALLDALAGENIASAVTSPGFIYAFIQLALIAPLAEEFAKPLVTLPIVGRLSRRDAFLVGAVAGAGFAAVENIIYAGFGLFFWAGILLVRALGGAIHPLGCGLVTLGWRDVITGEANAWPRWLARFGLAAAMHALWNGGSLLVITLAGAQFFGELPAEVDVLGLSAAGTTLALLVILGLVALAVGRSVVRGVGLPSIAAVESARPDFTPSDRSVAIWALACLVAIVPLGITGLQLVVGS